MNMLEIRGLRKRYRTGGTLLHPVYLDAVDGVDLTVREGEFFGVVGESGCGKSTLARLIMGIEAPTAGEVWLKGQRIDSLPERQRRRLRPKFQMVFQDSGSSLNPRKRVIDLIAEPMLYHRMTTRREAKSRVAELLALVGLPEDMMDRYPHELSGGQRQRVCLARALGLKPELLVLDEPVSALDVSVQAQILNLLRDLQAQLKLTCIFIGHGLAAVRYVSQRMGVMYMGRMVEIGDAQTLFRTPAHPYTRALVDAAPVMDAQKREAPRTALSGELGRRPESGCPLLLRCPYAEAACAREDGALQPVQGGGGHLSACMRAMTPDEGGAARA
ncbi:MAG: ABC transporter ATP-binding protein [Clostridiales bacterium]|nr:ABC transporter ATP-binding protein [Clostridiales bacterium]